MKRYLLFILVVFGFIPQVNFAQTKTPAKKKTSVKKPVVAKPKNDTTYSYYSNKKVSVKTGPWIDNEQKVFLYDLKGNITYTFTNSRKHGSTHTEFKYRPDGSVSETTTSMQPDGGIQHYKTIITFSQQNEPEWKRSEDYPTKVLAMPDSYYWDKNTGQWKKQEAMEGQPVFTK